MDVVAELEKALRDADQAWRASDELVPRLEVLRRLYRRVHELKNEELAQPNPAVRNSGRAQALHDELSPLPDRIEALPQVVRENELIRARQTGLLDWVRGIPVEKGSPLSTDSSPPEADTPPFLAASGREWERLVWRGLPLSPGWRLEELREDVDLSEFAATAGAREQALARRGIVLGVRCLTFQGMMRTWEWSLLVRHDELLEKRT